MGKLRLDKEAVEAAVLGGGFLGGGGGGSMEEGRRNGLLAIEFGQPELVDVDDLPDTAVVVTASAVGAPAAKTLFTLPTHFVRAVELLAKHGDIKIHGLNTSECGGIAITNGWVQAAVLGLPVVDAPCNGRAHPISTMGSMGLHAVEGYVSLQAAAGGDPGAGRYIEIFVRGDLQKTSTLIRQAAIQAGGMVAVARNPAAAAYVGKHAAVGAVRQCIALGQAMLERQASGPVAMAEAACEQIHGEVVGRGPVSRIEIETKGGLDVGRVTVQTGGNEVMELSVWNEYMSLEVVHPNDPNSRRRTATFPDLVSTVDLHTGWPVSSAMVKEGQAVLIVRVPHQHLILGAGMRFPELMRSIEDATGLEILRYIS